ncbi:MAG: LON peptidase substrate-binding domain-containing protein [Acidobacteria bacterium]|nr:LON peptidase substrate-binding domain-containing protein [Acidobacteriota bacterium]MCA1642003.1 LON peptidase substrate-binding domain-containing protein [Acidobacteriota bacterium]
MTDALEKVRGVRELPLFPLPAVLFPGVPMPLHVFEERYRRLLSDVRVTNNLFGVSFFDGAEEGGVERPAVGHVGCAAEVVEVQPLGDGRSNILTVGVVRYRVVAYVESGEPYLVARVEFFEDEAEDEALLARSAGEVTEVFGRIARAVRALNDDRAALPELSTDEPERLSFLVAAAMEMDNELKQELLELRSGAERLARLSRLLKQVVSGYEERARTHKLAKGNGHSARKISIDE